MRPDLTTSANSRRLRARARRASRVERRQQVVDDLVERGEVHGGREDVVRALAHVDVVVRVHALAGERRDHLVRVHVRRGAGAGLEDVDRELVVELAVRDAVAGGGDPLGLVGVEQPELGVHARGGGLDPAEPARDRRGDRLAGDGEVGDRLAGLAAPELVRCRSGVSHARRLAADGAALEASCRPSVASASRAAGRAARRRALGGVDRLPAGVLDVARRPLASSSASSVAVASAGRAARRARPRAAARRSRSRPSCSCRSRRSGRA